MDDHPSPSPSSLAELHYTCEENFENLLRTVLSHAKKSPTIQKFQVIAQDLDDQRVRFEIWASDINADEGTLDTKGLSEEERRTFELVRSTLLAIHSCLRDISKGIIEALAELNKEAENIDSETAPQQVIGTPAYSEARITIGKLHSLTKSLFDLVRPVLAIHCRRKQKGPYWARRQKILGVTNSEMTLDRESP